MTTTPLTTTLLILLPTLTALTYATPQPHTSRAAATLHTLSYGNPTHLLLTLLLIHHLRVLEILWGTKKFAAFLLSVLPYAVLTGAWSARRGVGADGEVPTVVVAALLAQFYKSVPYRWMYAPVYGEDEVLRLSSKWGTYALGVVPGMKAAGVIGWCVGCAWRVGILLGKGLVDWGFGLGTMEEEGVR